jgi:hypothetical protein
MNGADVLHGDGVSGCFSGWAVMDGRAVKAAEKAVAVAVAAAAVIQWS